ncbi:MAG: chloride channel protein [Pseudomonadota bacterium]|nr:chloride channel protein [Pseudomonadota bacterium]
MEKNINISNHLSPFAKNRFHTIINIFVFGIIMGLLMAFFANLFVTTVSVISNYRDTLKIFSFQLMEFKLNYAPVITLIIAAFVINILRTNFDIKRWNGPADSIYAAHRTDNELDIKTGYLSTLTALISASGGASVGLYGPLVHLGGTIGTHIKMLSKDLLSIDVFLGCGVAGAISAGFGAPLAGIIFAHEAILRHFSMRALAPIAIASFTANAATEKIFQRPNIFELEQLVPDLVSILPTTLICSPIFAVVAIVFMMSMRYAMKMNLLLKLKPTSLIYLGALVCGCTGMFFPEILGLGTSTIAEMLGGNFTFWFVFSLLVLKIGMTSICLGTGLFGGVFSPALFIGTASGSLLAKLCSLIGLYSASSVLALCGMAAIGGAIIGAPITAVLIILEITGSYQLALSTMASVAGCCLITHLFFGHSFFDRQLIDRGINVHLGRGHLKLMEEPVATYASSKFSKIGLETTCGNALKQLLSENFTEGYLVNEKNQFFGKVLISDLFKAEQSSPAVEHKEKQPLTLGSDFSVLQSIEACRNFVGESIPVIEEKSEIIIGIISEADLFSAYLDLDKQIKDLENG